MAYNPMTGYEYDVDELAQQRAFEAELAAIRANQIIQQQKENAAMTSSGLTPPAAPAAFSSAPQPVTSRPQTVRRRVPSQRSSAISSRQPIAPGLGQLYDQQIAADAADDLASVYSPYQQQQRRTDALVRNELMRQQLAADAAVDQERVYSPFTRRLENNLLGSLADAQSMIDAAVDTESVYSPYQQQQMRIDNLITNELARQQMAADASVDSERVYSPFTRRLENNLLGSLADAQSMIDSTVDRERSYVQNMRSPVSSFTYPNIYTTQNAYGVTAAPSSGANWLSRLMLLNGLNMW